MCLKAVRSCVLSCNAFPFTELRQFDSLDREIIGKPGGRGSALIDGLSPPNPPFTKVMMKLPSLFAVLTAVFALSLQAAFGQATVQSVYDEGVRLYKQQKYEEALAQFERILKVKPSHVYSRSFAKKCKDAIASNKGATDGMEKQLAQIIIPQINFTDAPIGDVLQYLSSRAEELSGGKVVPNFIYKGTQEQRQNTVLSLNLRNVPMTEAIRYVGQLTRTSFRYEEHAIVADPNVGQIQKAAFDDAAAAAEARSRPNPLFGDQEKKPKSIFD